MRIIVKRYVQTLYFIDKPIEINNLFWEYKFSENVISFMN